MATRKQTRQTLQDHFGDEVGHVSYSVKAMAWTVRESYFYRHGRTPEDVVKKVKELIPEAVVVEERLPEFGREIMAHLREDAGDQTHLHPSKRSGFNSYPE